MRRIGIVGGGPAGLLAARLLGDGCTVYEASRRPGHPPHCTGLVSPSTAERIGVGEAVDAVYERSVFLDDELRVLGYAEGRPLAVRLSRPLLEELLASEAEAAGARILLGHRVEDARPDGRLRVRGLGVVRHEWVVLADGAAAPVSAGLLRGRARCRADGLVGVEVRVVVERRLPSDEFYTIHGYRYAPEFFAWIVPVNGGREALIGLASRKPLKGLRELVRRVDRLVGVAGRLGLRSGIVLRGPPVPSPVAGRCIAVGDAACTSKPFTGGGLYAVSLLAPRLAEALVGGRGVEGYVEAYRALREELLLQRSLASMARVFKPVLHALQAVMAAGGCRVDYDRHSTALRCLL